MDEENLYYIVRIGTNSRIMNTDNEPLICILDEVKYAILDYERSGIAKYESISITEYKSKFT